MKRAPLAFASFAVLGVALAAQTAGPLTPWTEKVAGLKSLTADITVQQIGATAQSYKVSMQKPSSLRVDSSTELVIADGKTVTVYDKAKNTFYTKPQDEAELKGILKADQYALFRAFFDAKVYDGAKAKLGESRNLGGESVKPIDLVLDRDGKKKMTIFLPSDNVARKAESNVTSPSGTKTSVLTAKNVVLDGVMTPDAFAFKAPADAQEVQYADLMSAKWFTDLDEAKKVAAASGRKIFVDFYATWCGPCKKLEAEVFGTDEFKALSKKFVFLRIDVDAQPSVSAAFKIEAMPTQAVIKADGAEEGRTVGYADPESFFKFINAY